MAEKFEKFEKLENAKVDGKIIYNPKDGPDGVLPDIPRPAPKEPERCGNEPIKLPKKKPVPPTPLDPRLERQVKDSIKEE